MLQASFYLFVLFAVIFFLILYKDRRNLFLGIFFILSSLSFAVFLFNLILQNTENKVVYGIGIILFVISLFIVLIFPFALLFMFGYSSIMLVKREGLKVTNLLAIGVGLILLIYIIYWPNIAKYTYEYIWLNGIYIYVGLVILYFICIAVAYLVTSTLNIINLLPRKLDYVVVLGAGLVGERVTPLLAGRIQKGIKIYRKNPGSKLIMSGGQGSDEVVSEAFAMKNYALERGVPADDIIMEDKSRNTEENVKFSKKLIKDAGRFALVTNYYHVYRALVLAKAQGIRCIGYGASTKLYFSINAFVREFVGYLYFKRRQHIIILSVLTFLFVALIMVIQVYYFLNYGK
ncbi:ElyC/SanA/YdcF family protein [Gemella bergeri]